MNITEIEKHLQNSENPVLKKIGAFKTKQKQFSQQNVNDIFKQFKSINNSFIKNDGYKNIIGTSNPYQFNLFSNLILNPSTVSIDEFQKMTYTYPLISGTLTTLTNLIINRFGHYTHKNIKYSNFINSMFNSMNRPLKDILKDVLSGLWAGFSICEKNIVTEGRYYMLKDIEPRPAQSFLFQIDSQGHLLDDGIIQYFFNNLYTGYNNMLAFNGVQADGQAMPNPYSARGDLPYPWRTNFTQPLGAVTIPKNKCVHFAYKALDGGTSPYGRSMLRTIYDIYLIAVELNSILLNAANTASAPIPVVIVDPAQTNTDNNKNVMDSIETQLDNLSNPMGANYLLLHGKLNESIYIDKLNTAVNVEHLISAKNYLDKLILSGLLYTNDLAGTSEIGSYSRAETQQNILDRNIMSICDNLQDVILKQVIKPLLQDNFNEQTDFGSFIEIEDMLKDISLNMQKIQLLTEQGIILKPESVIDLLNLKYGMVDKVLDINNINEVKNNQNLKNIKEDKQ